MATLITSQPDSLLRHLNPLALALNLWRQRDLIRQFTWREIEGRYRGSNLGLLWSFVNPLALLLIYTFVFGVVFRSRWPNGGNGSLIEFALVLFSGMIAFNIFSECVARAPQLVISVPNYVKKVVFPLEILPVSALGAALFHGGVSLSILLLANLIVSGRLPWTLVLLPLVLLPLVLLSLGLGWFLSSLGVFIRDIGHSVGLVLQVLFFMTPIFYPIEAVPALLQPLIWLNPLTGIVENWRRVVLWGQLPSWSSLLLALVLNAVILILGYTWFMKTKKAFADVI